MDLKSGKEIIDEIEKTRNEINKSRYHISNADFRISKDGSSYTDEMWIKIKKDNELKLEQSIKKLKLLYQKFYLLKETLSDFNWKLELEILGLVLAKTENISHIEDSMYDEGELKKAIDQNELTIEKYYDLLDNEKDNKDAVVVINSAIKCFETDMKNHPWGEERLSKIKNNYEVKDERYFRV